MGCDPLEGICSLGYGPKFSGTKNTPLGLDGGKLSVVEDSIIRNIKSGVL